MAIRAAGLRTPEDLFAGSGIAVDVAFARRLGQRSNESDQIPGLFVRKLGCRHIRAGDAVADCVECTFDSQRMPCSPSNQIGSPSSASIVSMTGGTGTGIKLGAFGD